MLNKLAAMHAAMGADLGAAEKLVLVALVGWADEEGRSWRSVESIASRTSQSPSTVKRSITKLKDAKLLEDLGASGRRTRVLQVLIDCEEVGHSDLVGEGSRSDRPTSEGKKVTVTHLEVGHSDLVGEGSRSDRPTSEGKKVTVTHLPDEVGHSDLQLYRTSSSSTFQEKKKLPGAVQRLWRGYLAELERLKGVLARIPPGGELIDARPALTAARQKHLAQLIADRGEERLEMAIAGIRYSFWHLGIADDGRIYRRLIRLDPEAVWGVGRTDQPEVLAALATKFKGEASIAERWVREKLADRAEDEEIRTPSVTCQEWIDIKLAIQDSLDPEDFETWFGPSRVIQRTNGHMVVEVPNNQFVHMIESSYRDVLDQAAGELDVRLVAASGG